MWQHCHFKHVHTLTFVLGFRGIINLVYQYVLYTWVHFYQKPPSARLLSGVERNLYYLSLLFPWLLSCCYAESGGSGVEGSLQEISPEVLHLLLAHITPDFNNCGLTPEQKEAFLQKLKLGKSKLILKSNHIHN